MARFNGIPQLKLASAKSSNAISIGPMDGVNINDRARPRIPGFVFFRRSVDLWGHGFALVSRRPVKRRLPFIDQDLSI